MTYHLEFTSKIGCRLACSFCPQKAIIKSYKSKEKIFSISNFEKILRKLPTTIDIHFSGYTEPFLNPETADMMLLAKKLGFKIHLYTTLVDLDKQNLLNLKESNPDVIRIHVPDKTGLIVDDSTWIPLHDLFLSLEFKNQTYMSMGELTPKVETYFKEKGVYVELPSMLSRGGLVENINSRFLKGNIACAADRWHKNVVLPDGNVYVCCMDYSLSMPLGNLLLDDYSEIFLAAENYKKNINPPETSICRSCEWAVNI